jgi:hypothetical protein
LSSQNAIGIRKEKKKKKKNEVSGKLSAEKGG